MNDAIEAFRAVGEPTRFRALRILITAGRELCACEIIDVLKKPQYTISKSLGGLVSAGLVDERREGRMMMYSLIHGSVNDSIFAAVSSARATDAIAEDQDRLLARLPQRSGGERVAGC
jgi:ArsR family transcriptional regulator